MSLKDGFFSFTFINWFIIPWIIIILVVMFVYINMKSPEVDVIKSFVDLSGSNSDELFILDKKRAASEGVTEEENFPFYLKGSKKIGILLIHGFTASPYEMKELGMFLNHKGFGVYGVRLPGHASNPSYLDKLTFVDMYEGLKYGYFVLKNNYDKVFIIGQSMGALLALEVAAFNKVEGVILLSPAFKIKDKKSIFVPILRKFIKLNKKENFDEKYAKYYYDVRPVEGIYQLMKLSEHVKKVLHKIDIPIFIIQSKYDDIIDISGTIDSFEKFTTKNKKLEILNDKDIKHILTTDENPKKMEVFEKIYSWLSEVADVY